MTKVFARLRVVLVVVAMAVSYALAQSAKPITDWLVCGPFPFERGLPTPPLHPSLIVTSHAVKPLVAK